MCNLYISEFVYLWPEVRPDSWPLYCKPMLKILKCLLLRVSESKPPNYFSIMEDYLIGDDPGAAYWQGHRERSSEVMWRHKSFLSIRHDMMVLKTCKWYQTARLVKPRRLVCSMTISHNLVGEWPGLDLGSNFKLTCECYRIPICIASTRATKNVLILCLYVSWFKSYISIFKEC